MNVDTFNYNLEKEDHEFISDVKLSVYRSLLREIIPSMRAIDLFWQPGDDVAKIIFYHNGEINEAIQSHYSSIMAEVFGDPWEYHGKLIDSDYDVLRIDYPKPLPKKRGFAIYARKKPFEDPS